jgi:hypothetical protein
MIPCMGGFCTSREDCAHYYAESHLRPAERLCGNVEHPERVGSAAKGEVLKESAKADS